MVNALIRWVWSMDWGGGCGHYLVGGEIHVVRARGPNQM